MNNEKITWAIKPTHPGEFLREIVLPDTDLSVSKFAQLLGISRHTMRRILDAERPVTPTLAVRIGLLFNTTPESWLNMQTAHDLWLAEKSLRREAPKIAATGKKIARRAHTPPKQVAAYA